jgi:hypothetical protein
MKRKPSKFVGRRHSKNLMLRLSPAERRLTEALADFDGLKMAGAVRNALIVAARLAAGQRNFSREPFAPDEVESECERLADKLGQRTKEARSK